MEKKSMSFHKNDPNGVRNSTKEEAGQEFEPIQQPQVKLIGDGEFDQVIDLLIDEMGNHA